MRDSKVSLAGGAQHVYANPTAAAYVAWGGEGENEAISAATRVPRSTRVFDAATFAAARCAVCVYRPTGFERAASRSRALATFFPYSSALSTRLCMLSLLIQLFKLINFRPQENFIKQQFIIFVG